MKIQTLRGVGQELSIMPDVPGGAEKSRYVIGDEKARERAVALELCCRLSGATQRAVSQRFEYRHESAVGRALRPCSGPAWFRLESARLSGNVAA